MLTVSVALTPAIACTPRVVPDVLLSVALAESHRRTLAIHDNVTGEAFSPTNKQEAEQITSRLVAEDHDLGLLQINTTNLLRAGLPVATAFDPCTSKHASAQVPLEDYRGGATSAEQQLAILNALPAYNTGSPVAGLQTYVRLALAAPQKVIPAPRPPDVTPYTSPATAVPSSPASACEQSGWHYSADETCPRADAASHFSSARNATASPAEAAERTRPISEGNP